MAENRKKKNQQKLPWWLTPVLLLAVLAIWFGGEALGRGFQWLSDSQTSESTTTAQKVPSDGTLTVRFLDVGQGDSILLSCGEDTMLIDGGPVEEGQFLVSRLNRLVTMFIDYAELMAEDEQLMSMQDWLNETDRFLTNNRRNVLDGKGHISREAAAKKVGAIYEEFRKKQDEAYISEFDRQTEKYLKGE